MVIFSLDGRNNYEKSDRKNLPTVRLSRYIFGSLRSIEM